MALISRPGEFNYDVCLSFAGEDRKFVELVAARLRIRGVRVFYDEYERVELWGKDLYAHLDDVYRCAARYCVVFVSRHYADKLWTNHERQSAQARALRENREYILPARFDHTRVPGLRDTIGYIDLRSLSPDEFAELVIEKIGPIRKEKYLPPIQDNVFSNLAIEHEQEKENCTDSDL